MKNIAALFPGQGSQHVGMGKYLFENFAIAKQTFEEASDAVNINLKKLCFDGPEDQLQLTENTQPALLTTSIATYRALKEQMELNIVLTAGHSVGEYSSFVIGEVLTFSDAVRAVKKRGQFMQEAVPVGEGGMVAVMGLTPDQVVKMCKWAEEQTGLSPLSPANYNSPGQIVCSGAAPLIEWIRQNFKKEIFEDPQLRVKFIPLKVSAPFHCSLMKPAEQKMMEFFEDIKFADSKIPILQNLTAELETEAKKLKQNLIGQISGSVRWMQSMGRLPQSKADLAIELGSGSVLSGLNKKILPEFPCSTINDLESFKEMVRLNK
jgi:[acyl-carrier-protein] S-malonyltransferase